MKVLKSDIGITYPHFRRAGYDSPFAQNSWSAWSVNIPFGPN